MPRIHTGLAVAALMLLIAPGSAGAGEVSGVVTLDGKPVAAGILALRKPGETRPLVNVRLDGQGEYRIFLAPGRYEAMLPGSRNPVVVRSFHTPARQDLKFNR